ncbi:hypothetical protein V1477_010784 [Vespula maculifrons]|uniref:Uncharacterized protein n=1 Tax=Vespula maculifrons TaxID=7453 RepID=A0ABD2C2Y4_VESMC
MMVQRRMRTTEHAGAVRRIKARLVTVTRRVVVLPAPGSTREATIGARVCGFQPRFWITSRDGTWKFLLQERVRNTGSLVPVFREPVLVNSMNRRQHGTDCGDGAGAGGGAGGGSGGTRTRRL